MSLQQPVLVKSTFLSIMQPLTGLQQISCNWWLDGQTFVSPTDQASVTFKVRGYVPVGMDATPTKLVSNVLQEQIIGQRTVRITVKAEAFAPEVEASEILESLRVGLMKTPTTLALNAIDLGFQRATATVDLPNDDETRAVNTATMDLFFNGAAVSALAPIVTDGSPGYVASVNTTNKVPLTTTGP